MIVWLHYDAPLTPSTKPTTPKPARPPLRVMRGGKQ